MQPIAIVLQFVAVALNLGSCVVEASVAEAWGLRHWDSDEVSITSKGDVQHRGRVEEGKHQHSDRVHHHGRVEEGRHHLHHAASGMMRRHGSVEAEDEPESVLQEDGHRHVKHMPGMHDLFNALDLDGDGVIHTNEIKESLLMTTNRIPEDFPDKMMEIDTDKDGKLDFAEFSHALAPGGFPFEEEQHLHRRQVKRHASPLEPTGAENDRDHIAFRYDADHRRPHSANFAQEAALQEQRNDGDADTDADADAASGNAPSPSTQASWVTCGGHKAPTCAACVTTNAQGQTVFDHGHEWCNGDCAYVNNICKDKGSLAAGESHEVGAANGHASTSSVPDILNPNITKSDVDTINNAAADAIKEENIEAAEEDQKEAEEAEKKKFGAGKFFMMIIVSFSILLGICALISVIAALVYYINMKKEKTDDKAAEGEEGEEGEDAYEAEEEVEG